jgi:hypothetical protein
MPLTIRQPLRKPLLFGGGCGPADSGGEAGGGVAGGGSTASAPFSWASGVPQCWQNDPVPGSDPQEGHSRSTTPTLSPCVHGVSD